MIPERTVERLSIYRRLLIGLDADGISSVFSHQLAAIAHCTAAQVRRDLMLIGFTGSPSKGYDIARLVQCIGDTLHAPEVQKIALVGVGNLGRALLSYFTVRRPTLPIVAAFDNDPHVVNRIVHGCRVHPLTDLEPVLKKMEISTGMITVPAAAAQAVTDQLVHAGIRGILNFAPKPLKVPSNVYVENIDVTMFLDKVAYFTMQNLKKEFSKDE